MAKWYRRRRTGRGGRYKRRRYARRLRKFRRLRRKFKKSSRRMKVNMHNWKRTKLHKYHKYKRTILFSTELASTSYPLVASDPPNWMAGLDMWTLCEDTVAPTCPGMMSETMLASIAGTWDQIKPIKLIHTFEFKKFDGPASTNTYDNTVTFWYEPRQATADPVYTAAYRLASLVSAQNWGSRMKVVHHGQRWSIEMPLLAMKKETDWGGQAADVQERWRWCKIPWMTTNTAGATADVRRLRCYGGAWALQDVPKNDQIVYHQELLYAVRGTKLT